MSNERVLIPVEDIEVLQSSLRGAQTDSEDFKKLQASIEEWGIQHNLTVRPSESADGKYVLIDGLQRLAVARLIGLDEVPVMIQDVDERDAMLLQIQGNIQTIATKPAEYAKQLVRILALCPEMTIADLADKVCQDPDWINGRLGLLRLHPDIQKLVDDGSINLAKARALSQIEDQEEQKNWVRRAIDQTTEEFVPACKERAFALRKAAREEKGTVDEKFVPVPRQRNKSEIMEEITKPVARNAILKPDTSPALAWKLALEWSMRLDTQTLNAAEKKWTEEKAARDARRAEKAAALEAAKAAKAAEAEAAVLG